MIPKVQESKFPESSPCLCAVTALGADTPALPPAVSLGCDSAFGWCSRDRSPALPGWRVGNSVPVRHPEAPPWKNHLEQPLCRVEWGAGPRGQCRSCWGCRCPLPGSELNRGSVCSQPPVLGDFLLPRPLLLLARLHLLKHKRGTVRLPWPGSEPAGKAAGFVGWGEGGHPSLGGQRVLPRIHPTAKGMFSLQPLQSLHPAWHLPAARLGGHRILKIVPLLTPRAEL